MNSIYLQIEVFYQRLQAGIYDHPVDLAQALEALANLAWDDIDEIYQSSLRIDG